VYVLQLNWRIVVLYANLIHPSRPSAAVSAPVSAVSSAWIAAAKRRVHDHTLMTFFSLAFLGEVTLKTN
jgi:hypothetical protein